MAPCEALVSVSAISRARRDTTFFGQKWPHLSESLGVGDQHQRCELAVVRVIGFHIVVILGLLPTPLMLYLGAVVGAAVTIWLWRVR
jgi:uncharacterized membrane protein SpoIIM required for sporulation